VRIISLVPSATETLIGWGTYPIGVSRFCEQEGYQTYGGTKDPAIDEILRAAPDVVVMCDQENRIEDYEALVHAGTTVFVFSITCIEAVRPEMNRLRDVLELGRLDVASIPKQERSHQDVPVRVWVPIWKRPWMAIGGDTYADSLLRAAGFVNVCDRMGERYPECDLDQARSFGSQVVLAPSEPYPFAERHRPTLEAVAPVRFVDGRDLFWWGTRTDAALTRLCELRSDVQRTLMK
jgi:ABC-type Fe3+-hydroxamate transport system substrate-binding protein